MFKKALIASAILAATSGLAFANGGSFVQEQPHHTGAFYIGAAVSRDTGHFETTGINTTSTAYGAASSVSQTKLDFDWSADGIDGEIFGGYGMTFQDQYTLGVEIFGSISSLKGNYNTNFVATVPGFPTVAGNTRGKIELDHTFGISLLPGIKLSDSTTLYGRIGWVYSKFKISDTGTPALAPTARGFVPVATGGIDGRAISRNKSKSGLQLGIGMETMVTNNVGIRGEWDWEYYGKIKQTNFAGANNTAGVVNTEVASYEVKPQLDRFKLGVLYHFYA